MMTHARQLAADLLFLGGAAGVVYGLWLVSPAVALVVGGVMAMTFGVIASSNLPRNTRPGG